MGTNGFKRADGAGQLFWAAFMFAGHLTKQSLRLASCRFFIDLLKQAELFDPYVAVYPLQFSSPNAPEVQDILGAMQLSIVTGGRRYAHVNAVRHDGVNPPLLGMSSDDSRTARYSLLVASSGLIGRNQFLVTTSIIAIKYRILN